MPMTIKQYEELVHARALQITELTAENARLKDKVEALNTALQAWKTSYCNAKPVAYLYQRSDAREGDIGLVSVHHLHYLGTPAWKEIELYTRPSSRMIRIGYIHPLDVDRKLAITTERIYDAQVPVYAAIGETNDG